MKRISKLALLLLLTLSLSWAQADDGSDEELFSVNFRNVDLVLVIESVARLVGKNFLIDPRVRGSVTLIATEPVGADSLYDILLTILHVYGYTAVPSDEAIRVLPAQVAQSFAPSIAPSEASAEIINEIITLKYVDSTQVVNVVRPLMSQQAQLVPLANNSKILVIDTRANIDRLKKIIASVDIIEADDMDIIGLRYTQAGDIKTIVMAIYSSYKKLKNIDIQVDERTNRLIVIAPVDIRRAIRALIADLDVELPSSSNVKVIYLKFAKADRLAPLLESIISEEGFNPGAISGLSSRSSASGAPNIPDNVPEQVRQQAAQRQNRSNDQQDQSNDSAPTSSGAPANASGGAPVTIQADEDLNALIVNGPREYIEAVMVLINQLDLPRAQVVIEVIIAEVSNTITRSLGIDSIIYGPAGGYAADITGNLAGLATEDGTLDALSILDASNSGILTGIGGASSDLSAGWGFLVKALHTDAYTNILSTPYIVTLDNQEAEFVVGDNIPVVTGSTDSEGDPFQTIERQDVGIALKILPQINGDNSIRMDLEQEISSVTDNTIDAVDVVTSTRKIVTSVNVRDGGLIALGGLMQDNQSESSRKIPLLGDIPIIGNLFKSQSNNVDKTNLMLFMRPRILKDDASVASLSYSKYNAMRLEQLNARTELDNWLKLDDAPVLRKLDSSTLIFDFGDNAPSSDSNLLEAIN